ncbi:MAG: hypothetical protein Q4A01_10855 [Coriobacteriales bacterium]|nr:hypothetical protein [Coriobacteriales bacterium]
MRFARDTRRRGGCVLLAACLVLAGATPGARVARAETSQEVRAQAEREHARLDELASQMADIREELDDYEEQIDELADQSIEVQGKLIEDRGSLSSMVDTTYRWGTPSVLDIALSSKTIEDFVSRLYYANRVTEWQTACVEDLREDKARLERNMDEIEEARTERERAAEELDAAYEEVSATVDSLMARAATLEREEREAEERRIAEAARRAEQERKRKEAEQEKAQAEKQARQEAASQFEDARKVAEQAQQPAAEQKAASEPAPQATPEPEQSEQGDPAPEQSQSAPEPAQPTHVELPAENTDVTSDEGNWITCIASAYAIADNDPPGSTATASGVPLDESVPTVALPLSMDPSRFYGQRIQIEYQGMRVIATITDCGDLDGGNRGLDLTPAVFRAFGASTCDDWGLRTVRYRFL